MSRSEALSAAAVAIAALLLLAPACHLLHRCGCTWAWAGAAAHCNVHAVSGPHCPWCEHGWLGAAAGAIVLAGEWRVFRSARRRGLAAPGAGALALASMPAWALAAGLLTWLPTDYPDFLVSGARARLGLPDGPIRCIVTRAQPPVRAGAP